MTNASDFADWLNTQLRVRDWKQADLVRRSGVSSGLISQILSGQRRPGPDTCKAIAHAFGMRDIEVLRIAGRADDKPAIDEEGENVLFEFYKLPADDRKHILDEIRGLRRLREEQAKYEAHP